MGVNQPYNVIRIGKDLEKCDIIVSSPLAGDVCCSVGLYNNAYKILSHCDSGLRVNGKELLRSESRIVTPKDHVTVGDEVIQWEVVQAMLPLSMPSETSPHKKGKTEKEETNLTGLVLVTMGIMGFFVLLMVAISKSCVRESTYDYYYDEELNAAIEETIDEVAAAVAEDVDSELQTHYVENVVMSDNQGQYYYTGYVNAKGLPHGEGTAFYMDRERDRYIGNFVNGKREGDDAVFTFKNGDHFRGSFENDGLKSGTLTLKATGNYFFGTFVDSSPYKGNLYNRNGQLIGKFNVGIFTDINQGRYSDKDI